MYFQKLLIHSIFLLIFVKAVLCLKKDIFYCEQSSPCVCVSANNDKVDLYGINKVFNVTTNVTLYYQPCPNDELSPNEVAVSIYCYLYYI